MLTEREKYIRNIFLPEKKSPKKTYLSEQEVSNIIKKIGLIGQSLGFVGNEQNKDKGKSEKRRHKFDVWIAKEAKKNLDILDEIDKIRFIKDWIVSTKEDLFKYDFESALKAQRQWHADMVKKFSISEVEIPDVDENRILFKSSDQEHFFYLLDHRDLDYEGATLSHCVNGKEYKQKIKQGRSIIVSLRDIKNVPQVTIEFDAETGRVLQQYGYDNKEPKKQLKKLIVEFALHVCEYEGDNKELLDFLNLYYVA